MEDRANSLCSAKCGFFSCESIHSKGLDDFFLIEKEMQYALPFLLVATLSFLCEHNAD